MDAARQFALHTYAQFSASFAERDIRDDLSDSRDDRDDLSDSRDIRDDRDILSDTRDIREQRAAPAQVDGSGPGCLTQPAAACLRRLRLACTPSILTYRYLY